jgi:hypothetical protein
MADPRAPTRDAPTSPRAHEGCPYASWFGGEVHGRGGKPSPYTLRNPITKQTNGQVLNEKVPDTFSAPGCGSAALRYPAL